MLTFLRCGLKYWWFFFTFPTELEKNPPSCIILDITLKNIYNIFYDMLRC